jgi:hypothetical protein
MEYLGVDDEEAFKFFKMFPPTIRTVIENDAKKRMGGMKFQ